MNNRTHVLAAVIAVLALMGGTMVIASDDSVAETIDIPATLKSIAEFNGDGWEVGGYLDGDDGDALVFAKSILKDLQEYADSESELSDLLDANSLGELLSIATDEDVDADFEGDAYVKIACVKTSEGFSYILKGAGQVSAELTEIFGYDDLGALKQLISLEMDVHFGIIINTDENVIPKDFSASANLNFELIEERNYEHNYTSNEFTVVRTPVEKNVATIDANGTATGWIEGLDVSSIQKIMYGDPESTIDAKVGLACYVKGNIHFNGDYEKINNGMEVVEQVRIPCGMMSETDIPEFDYSDAESLMEIYKSEGIEGLIKAVLDQSGSSYDEDALILALANSTVSALKEQARKSNLGSYYVYGGKEGNIGNAKSIVNKALSNVDVGSQGFLQDDRNPHYFDYTVDSKGNYDIQDEEGDQMYSVKLIVDPEKGSVDVASYVVADGETFVLPAVKATSGYVFSHWVNEESETVSGETTIVKNMTFTAVFEKVSADNPSDKPADDPSDKPSDGSNSMLYIGIAVIVIVIIVAILIMRFR